MYLWHGALYLSTCKAANGLDMTLPTLPEWIFPQHGPTSKQTSWGTLERFNQNHCNSSRRVRYSAIQMTTMKRDELYFPMLTMCFGNFGINTQWSGTKTHKDTDNFFL
jgi:competence transcription factor ComK